MVVIRRKDFLRPKKKKYQPDAEKYNVNKQSSTKASPKSPKSPTKIGEIGEIGETSEYNTFVYSSKMSQNDELITEETVEGKDERYKVTINIYRVGEEEKARGDKVVKRAKLKFVMSYGSVVKECVDDCHDAISKIARATNYNIPRKVISEKIAELREEYTTSEEIPLIDYVRQKYPAQLTEIEKDPFSWILQRTKEIVGYERLKLLTLLAVVSSRMKRVPGISRIHINIVGLSGAGKSSVVKSVLKFVVNDMKFDATRFTEKALGYLNIDSFDGKIVFLEQIDNQNVAYLREAMSEEEICTFVAEKVATPDGGETHSTAKKCIEGQPAFITTSVSDNISLEREQIANRMLNVYLKYTYSRDIIKSILERAENEVADMDKMAFTAYLLTRPDIADVKPVENEIIAFVDKLAELTRLPVNRTAEILRNLVRAVAIARGKTKADVEDFNFVMENFQLDVLYNGLGLTERDVEIVEKLPDANSLKTQEVADALRMSKQYVLNLLKNLERKGIVEGEKEDNRTFTWSLTALGLRIKTLVGDKEVIEVRNEKGELVGVVDGKFRLDGDARNGGKDALPGNDGNGMQGGDGETNPVIQAYKYLKGHGWVLLTDIAGWYGDDTLEELKRKDMITFNNIDGVEYVGAK